MSEVHSAIAGLPTATAAAEPVPVYQAVNNAVLKLVPAGARSVLDLGCGTGVLGARIKASRACAVVGVTFSDAEADLAARVIDRVVTGDLNSLDPAALGVFDCIICSHVLEHLVAPERLLARLQPCLAPGGRLLVALPNALFWKQRFQFLRGRFRYTEGGLMDRTHLRFFDWSSAEELVRAAGFDADLRLADGGFPLSTRLGPKWSQKVDRWALQRFPGLFGFQFVLACRRATGPGAPAAAGY